MAVEVFFFQRKVKAIERFWSVDDLSQKLKRFCHKSPCSVNAPHTYCTIYAAGATEKAEQFTHKIFYN